MNVKRGNRFRNITPAEKVSIINRYNSGDSVDTIVRAQQYGERLIYQILHEAGVALYRTDRYTKFKALDPTNNKVCTRCVIEKPKSDFSHASLGNHLRGECRQCTVKRTKIRNLKKLGLTLEDYEGMIATQHNLCASCGQLETYMGSGG